MSILTIALPLPISDNDLLFFTKHLSVLINSGIPMGEALPILTEQSKNPSLTRIIESLANQVSNGKTLGEALDQHKSIFSNFYRSIVSIGEKSGTLDKNLTYLATELEKNLEFRHQIQGVLLYPSIVISIALIVGAGISIFVLPQLANLFTSLNITLPLTTRILLWLSNFSRSYGVLILFLLIFGSIALILAFRTKTSRKYLDPLLLKLPVVGQIIEYAQVAQICRNVGLMLKAGVPILRIFQVVGDSTDNTVYQKYLDWLYQAVQGGKTLEAELKSSKYRFMPPTIARMLGVGERSGTLDESFLYLGDYYAQEVNETTKKLPTILEPVLLVIIAGVVLFVALAIITPIYQFTGSIRR